MPGQKDQVDSSDLNRHIQIQTISTTADGQGGEIVTWSTVYTCWANFVDKAMGRGLSRLFKFWQLYPEADRAIQIRFQQSVAIDASMRVLYSAHSVNHLYQILGVQNTSEANVSMWLMCQELQAQAVN